MLLDHFFKIVKSEQNDDNYLLTIELNIAHPIFEGHFPGKPVVPGVCQVQMLEEILSSLYKSRVTLKKANSIKFLKLIEPAFFDKLYVQIKVQGSQPEYSVVCQYYNDSHVFFKLKGDFHG